MVTKETAKMVGPSRVTSVWDRIESISLSGFDFVAKIHVKHIRSNNNSIYILNLYT